MDLTYSSEQLLLREEVAAWFAQNVPAEERPPSTETIAAKVFDKSWQKMLFEGGWAGVSWPREYGGRGLDAVEQLIFLQEYARAGAPDEGARFNGLNLGGPTIITYGSPEHKAEHLPPILKGETIWCQGFSEPGAGSDLSAICTRGELDGEELVINGQKTWTSYARAADWQQVVVRTDTNKERHHGLSWVICNMNTPGITIVPIKDMAGGDDLHDVFYDDVRVPVTNIVGGMNNGWKVCMGQLGFERGTAFMTLQIELTKTVEDLIEFAKGRSTGIDEGYIQDLAKIRAEVRALQAMTLMAISRIEGSRTPGAEGSMLKLYYSDLIKRVGKLAVHIVGIDRLNLSMETGRWSRWLLWSFGVSIGGGTSEIQRNIIAEKMLGLPRG